MPFRDNDPTYYEVSVLPTRRVRRSAGLVQKHYVHKAAFFKPNETASIMKKRSVEGSDPNARRRLWFIRPFLAPARAPFASGTPTTARSVAPRKQADRAFANYSLTTPVGLRCAVAHHIC